MRSAGFTHEFGSSAAEPTAPTAAAFRTFLRLLLFGLLVFGFVSLDLAIEAPNLLIPNRLLRLRKQLKNTNCNKDIARKPGRIRSTIAPAVSRTIQRIEAYEYF